MYFVLLINVVPEKSFHFGHKWNFDLTHKHVPPLCVSFHMQQRINNCKEKERQNTSKRNKKTNVIRITNTSETSSDIFSIHEKNLSSQVYIL